ncbi:membrane-spanning 4-domains subfamily A member 8-like [Pseudophryne corroboree]|uniref:membrane-spanning 4-domains subfamily A member 8-like n=1 Tax=Pseudophryne corroboree TaxID=495146 RepID=UPI0030821DDF
MVVGGVPSGDTGMPEECFQFECLLPSIQFGGEGIMVWRCFPWFGLDVLFPVKINLNAAENNDILVLLFVGAFAQVGAGTVLASNAFSQLSNTLLYGIPFWAPVCYIITGSLLLSAYVDPTPRRVRLSLFFDIITTIFSIVGLVFNVKDLEKLQSDPFADSQGSVYNIHYVLICTNVVILCFAVFATTFGFYVLCCVRREEPQLSVIENTFVTSMLPPDFPETPPFPPPPPYTSQGAFKGSTTI